MDVVLMNGDITEYWYKAAHSRGVVGVDIETSGLDRIKDRIATFQMFVPGVGTVMVRSLSIYPMRIIRLLEHRTIRKIFHFGVFDLAFLMRDYSLLIPYNIADTKIASDIVDPHKTMYYDPAKQRNAHTLLALVHHHFGYLMDKSLAVSDWFAETLNESQLEYAAKDVEYLPDLLHTLESQLLLNGDLYLAKRAYDHITTRVLLDLKVGRDVYHYS